MKHEAAAMAKRNVSLRQDQEEWLLGRVEGQDREITSVSGEIQKAIDLYRAQQEPDFLPTTSAR